MREITDIVEPVDGEQFVGRHADDVAAALGRDTRVRSVLDDGGYGSFEPVQDADGAYVDRARFDPHHGILELDDPQYPGEYGRALFTMLFEAADETDDYRGVLAVDQHGAGGIWYDDGTAVEYGVKQSLIAYIQDVVSQYWMDDGTADDVDQPPYDDVYRVELEGQAAKYWEKADGTCRDPMNTTLQKLARDPYQGAITRLNGGREVVHRFADTERLVGEVDEDSGEVSVRVAGHYEDIIPFKQA